MTSTLDARTIEDIALWGNCVQSNYTLGFRSLRLKPLRAACAALFAISPPATADIVNVTNCLDTGAGSLRAAVAAANSADVVNMTALNCSTITLTSGQIFIPQLVLTLQGPGADKLSIEGHFDRVLTHEAVPLDTAALYINDLTIGKGYGYGYYADARGGCILGLGTLRLENTNVHDCTAYAYEGNTRGGAVFADVLKMYDSTVTGGYADCFSYHTTCSVQGGGVFSNKSLLARGSTISGNSAPSNASAEGGGIFSIGPTILQNSTVSGNTSKGNGGGISSVPTVGSVMSVQNSTISGNSAAGFVGGIQSAQDVSLTSSTIAFNTASFGSPAPGTFRSPGVHIFNAKFRTAGSILANNTYGGAGKENDLSFEGSASLGIHSYNLVRATTTTIEIDTRCPLLGPLRNNGGATRTHALMSHSPAIDAPGNLSTAFLYDQRVVPYLRLSGTSIDIGAYEVQQDDIVYNAGFDGCPSL